MGITANKSHRATEWATLRHSPADASVSMSALLSCMYDYLVHLE